MASQAKVMSVRASASLGQCATLRPSEKARHTVLSCRSSHTLFQSKRVSCSLLPATWSLCSHSRKRLDLKICRRERTMTNRGAMSTHNLGNFMSSVTGSQFSTLKLTRRKRSRKGCIAAQASIVKPAIAVAGSVLSRIPAPILIPSCVGAIVYALTGLEGLVRWTRNRCKKLLNQPEEVPGEDNWSSSRVRKYVLPYIKPVVIWAAIFILCGALDRLPTPNILNKVKVKAVNVLRVFASVFSVTYCITVLIQHMQAVLYKPVGATEQVGKELAMQTIEAAIWFLGFALGMELLGVASNSFITAGGIGTLVFTFAGKEIVGNALSGMTIQATKPFTVGDWISIMVNGQFVEGHVENMGWWQLTLKTFERESSRIANQQVINSVITNVTAKTHWRFKSYIHLYLFTPEEQVQKIVMDIRKLLAEHSKIEHRTLHRRVFYDGHNISVPSKDILVSCYFQTRWQEEYAKLKEELMYEIERIISLHGSRYATPIRTHDYTAGQTPPTMSPSAYDSPTQRLFLAEIDVYKNRTESSSKLGVVDVTPSSPATVDVTPLAVVDVEVAKGEGENGAASKNGGAPKSPADVSEKGAVTVKGADVSQNGSTAKVTGVSEKVAARKESADVSKDGTTKVADVGRNGAAPKEGDDVSKSKPREETGLGYEKTSVDGKTGSDGQAKLHPDRNRWKLDGPHDGALERELAEITARRRAASPGRFRVLGNTDSAHRDGIPFSSVEAEMRHLQPQEGAQPRVSSATPLTPVNNPLLTHVPVKYNSPEEAAAAASAFSAAAAEAAAAAQAFLDRMHASGAQSAGHIDPPGRRMHMPGGQSAGQSEPPDRTHIPGGQSAGWSEPPKESTSYSRTGPSSGGHAQQPFVTPLNVGSGSGEEAKRSPRKEKPLGPRMSDRPEASSSPLGGLEPLREVETMSDVPYRGIGEAASPGREWSKQYFAGDRQVARGFNAVSEFEHLHDTDDEEHLRVSEADEVEDLGPMSEEELAAWRQADSAVASTSGTQESTRVDSSEAAREPETKGPVGARGEAPAAQQQARTDGRTGPLKEKLAGLETMGLSRSDITLLGIAIDKTGRQSAVLDSAFDPSISPTQLAQRGAKGQGGSPPESGSGKQGGGATEDGAQEKGEKEPAGALLGKEGALPAGDNAIPPVTEQMG